MKEQPSLEAGQNEGIQIGLPQFVRLSEVVPIKNPASERSPLKGNISADMSSRTGGRLISTPLIGQRVLDFGRPLQARKWLRLLQEEPGSGIRIRPNLNLGRNPLGFTFDSNHLGLRGPCSADGRAVVLGTSFAMGFAVDKGKDWFSDLLHPSSWFNAGLPVGPEEWAALLEAHHRGERDLALVLYHPNFWPHALSYTKWRNSGRKVFEFFAWKTGLYDCLRLHWRKASHRRKLLAQGKRLIIERSGDRWCLDATYSVLGVPEESEVVNRIIKSFSSLLGTFRRVLFVRLPIKEELLPERNLNDHFTVAHKSYDAMWHFTREKLGGNGNILFLEAEGFQLEHYHGFDTHLNEEGNRQLRLTVRKLLVQNGMANLVGT